MAVSTVSSTNDLPEQPIDQWGQLVAYTIGRHSDNRIILSSGKISGQHARLIQCTETSFVLEDLASKNGTFVNGTRIARKVIDRQDTIRLADAEYTADQLLSLISRPVPTASIAPVVPAGPQPPATPKANPLDFTDQFASLQNIYEQYPQLRRSCRNRDKMIRTGSVILSSVVGVTAAFSTGGAALPLIHVLSGAGLSVLIPTVCSALLSTDEKLEVMDKEYRERYRCPNPACRDSFGSREWDLLAQQKTCRRCQAIWVH